MSLKGFVGGPRRYKWRRSKVANMPQFSRPVRQEASALLIVPPGFGHIKTGARVGAGETSRETASVALKGTQVKAPSDASYACLANKGGWLNVPTIAKVEVLELPASRISEQHMAASEQLSRKSAKSRSSLSVSLKALAPKCRAKRSL